MYSSDGGVVRYRDSCGAMVPGSPVVLAFDVRELVRREDRIA